MSSWGPLFFWEPIMLQLNTQLKATDTQDTHNTQLKAKEEMALKVDSDPPDLWNIFQYEQL